MLLAIIIRSKSDSEKIYSTIYHKWYNEYRSSLFSCINYTDVTRIKINGSIPKIPSEFVAKLLEKMRNKSNRHILPECFRESTEYQLFYFRAVQYWFKILDREPIFEEDGMHKVTGEMKPIAFSNVNERNAVVSILSSNLFFLNYIIWSSCQVVNSRDFNLSIDFSSIKHDVLQELALLGKELQVDYQKHSHIVERNYSKKGRIIYEESQTHH